MKSLEEIKELNEDAALAAAEDESRPILERCKIWLNCENNDFELCLDLFVQLADHCQEREERIASEKDSPLLALFAEVAEGMSGAEIKYGPVQSNAETMGALHQEVFECMEAYQKRDNNELARELVDVAVVALRGAFRLQND